MLNSFIRKLFSRGSAKRTLVLLKTSVKPNPIRRASSPKECSDHGKVFFTLDVCRVRSSGVLGVWCVQAVTSSITIRLEVVALLIIDIIFDSKETSTAIENKDRLIAEALIPTIEVAEDSLGVSHLSNR
jgi:hypothetical protein